MEVFQGHDGSQVVVLQDKPFNALIEEYRLTLDKEPWYLDATILTGSLSIVQYTCARVTREIGNLLLTNTAIFLATTIRMFSSLH